MELYIQIRNGQPFEHPIFGDNFRQAFPDIDVNNLPPEFAKFERVERPRLGVYQVMIQDEPTYEFVDGVWKDVWHVRDMTAEEIAAKQQAAKDDWAALPNRDNFTAWTFDEATLKYVPPIPYPEGSFVWDGAVNLWKEMPARPDDGKPYKWDRPSWSWVEVI
jgi:hypothetical protein